MTTGICDYAGSHKIESGKRYAVVVAAMGTKVPLKEWKLREYIGILCYHDTKGTAE